VYIGSGIPKIDFGSTDDMIYGSGATTIHRREGTTETGAV
jgi:hypothetical protein